MLVCEGGVDHVRVRNAVDLPHKLIPGTPRIALNTATEGAVEQRRVCLHLPGTGNHVDLTLVRPPALRQPRCS
jgi:hypothetical protein